MRTRHKGSKYLKTWPKYKTAMFTEILCRPYWGKNTNAFMNLARLPAQQSVVVDTSSLRLRRITHRKDDCVPRFSPPLRESYGGIMSQAAESKYVTINILN
jgi:hypothetical protein